MYIDPNTGGMLFQALAAGFLAITGFFLVFSGRIRAGIARLRRAGRKEENTNEDKPAE